MKKIAKKLIFSSLALGASVLTLTTTTYAWYVQNNTAQATNITASTADNDSDSLFISQTGSTGWGASLAYADTSLASLVPASLKTSYSGFGADQFCLPNDAKNAETPSAAPTGKAKVAATSFYLISTNSDMTVVPTLMVENVTDATPADTENKTLPTQTSYSTEGTGVAVDTAFSIDAVRALRMAVVLTNETTSTQISSTVYDVLSIAKQTTKTPQGAWQAYAPRNSFEGVQGVNDTTLYGANAYYKDIVGKAPTFEFAETATPATTFAEFDLTKGQKVKVEIFIWLEGTDKDCFDSCAGQEFKFGFDFTKKVVQNNGD